jgi:CubicO group peptidase (beta-lactamase class C family)
MQFKHLCFCAFLLIFSFSVNSQTYKGTQAGKPLRKWYIAGPMKVAPDSVKTPSLTQQENFFNRTDDEEFNVSYIIPASGIPDLTKWKTIDAWNDNVDFDSIFKHADFVSAYAYAVIVADAAKQVMFAIGSDDAVKVWHNGKLVHKMWAPRGIVQDNDIIPLSLVKGKNEILIEVQDMQGGWGFTARFLDGKALAEKLVKTAAAGDVDETKKLIGYGANVNGSNENGLTPVNAARINGRDDIEKLLISQGAKETDVPAADKLVDGLYGKVNNKSNPGIAVLIAKNGKIIYDKGYGYADLEHKVKISPQTKFRIGSITKQFVASAILKLQEQGKLNVNDKLSKYFPDFPRSGEVGIHQLLTHTSGIHSFTNKETFLADVVKPITNDSLLNYFRNDEYDFNPGERYQYNNSGYFLLGLIIEKVTGEKYGDFLKKTFFDPIGMHNTGVYSTRIKLTNEALGYEKANDAYKRALNWNMDWAGGAGSLYSTTEDLYKWNEAMFKNKVLKPESMKAAFTPVVLNSGSMPPGIQYGYGWGLNEYRGVSAIAHSGGLHGFISQLLRVPKDNLTVVLLTNVMPPQVEIDPMKVAELYIWKGMSKQTSFAQQQADDKELEKYVGRYDLTQGMVMTITKEKDGLFAQVSGQNKFPIFQSSPGHFFWKVVEATVVFMTDDKGNVTHGHFEQGSFKVDAAKIKDIQTVQADTSLFESFHGTYKYRENTNIIITSNNGKLYAEATGDAKYELLPLSPMAFLINELNANLTFKKDASGKVNAIHVMFRGDERDAVRIP